MAEWKRRLIEAVILMVYVIGLAACVKGGQHLDELQKNMTFMEQTDTWEGKQLIVEDVRQETEIVKIDEHFVIEYTEGAGYHYAIYNTDHELVREEDRPNWPSITYVGDNIIEILFSAGTDVYFCTYYDIENDRFSQQYNGPETVKYGMVAYLEWENGRQAQVVVRDIFDEWVYYKEFALGDTSNWGPTSTYLEFTDENTLCVSYVEVEPFAKKELYFDLRGGIETKGWRRAELFLEEQIPELEDFDYWISKKSGGQAFLICETWDVRPEPEYDNNNQFLGNYYAIYVGEQWEDHHANWHWFYVNEEINEILWMDIVTCEFYTLDEWRNSPGYQTQMDAIRELRGEG